jgi:hypothetical protein
MSNWLESGFSLEMGGDPRRAEWLVLAAHPDVRTPLTAALARIGSTSTDYLFLVGLSVGIPEALTGRLVALALMDRRYALLEPTVMPPRAPMAVLRSDGTFRQMVTRTFSPWALQEMVSVGDFLQRSRSDLLRAVTAALNGQASSGLQPAPADFPLYSDTDPALGLPLASVAEGVPWGDPPAPPRERHRHVRSEYERDRYLAHLSLEQVVRRGNDIFRNVHQLDDLGRVTLDSQDLRLYYWMDRFTEYIHELSLRGVDARRSGPQLVADIPLPAEGDEWPRSVGAAVAAFALPPRPMLVRYGKVEHVRDAWEYGVLRLGPASSYDDAYLDPARRDDELTLALDVDGTVLPFIADGRVGWNSETLRFSANAELRSNFLVHCMSSSLRARLFMDFGERAALVIKTPDEFRRRFEQAARKARPEWLFDARAVRYYDPLNTTPGEVSPPFWKHFRYAYQEEVRFVLMPPRPETHLDPLFIELGSLKDISTPLLPGGSAQSEG